MEGRTTLLIAHRLSSVVKADRIMVLEDGRMVESGNHGELVAAGGVYAELMAQQQDLDEESGGTEDTHGHETAPHAEAKDASSFVPQPAQQGEGQ